MDENNLPKILFITVNGWNNTTGTATIPSIIKGYPKDKVANIFIRRDYPNSDTASRFFGISEIDVYKSIIFRKRRTGKEIYPKTEDNNAKDEFVQERETQNRMKKIELSVVPFIRDALWKLGCWKSKELNDFIDEFAPDIVMFPIEGIIHFNNLCKYVAKRCAKPVGLFFWDDNFTYKKSMNFVSKIYRVFLRKNVKSIVKDATFGFSITPKMQKECKQELGFNTRLITKPMQCGDFDEYVLNDGVLKILYTGSLYIDRDKTVLKLIDAVKKINKTGQKFFVDIYSGSDLSDEEQKLFSVDGVCALHKPVLKEEVLALQKSGDILLFCEALEGKYKNAARLSFSTKLIDYFSARRTILAIGPKDIAPMEYLKDNNIALTAGNEKEIEQVLNRIIDDRTVLRKYAEYAYKFGMENHSQEKTFAAFEEEVIKAYI